MVKKLTLSSLYGTLGTKSMGLNDQLKLAASPSVIENLLQTGVQYTDASPKTQRRWKSVATRRLKELQTAQETKTVTEKKTKSARK